ncbi:MAG TPA: hypothetical protein VKX28_03880 [Xanthobacteraceae bacterium]|nr:hypothetical protein [Xanthobacteraceae bacterium]
MLRQFLVLSTTLAVTGAVTIGSAAASPSNTVHGIVPHQSGIKGRYSTYTTCKIECMQPTGKYLVCRSNLDRQIVSEKLIDINACMH